MELNITFLIDCLSAHGPACLPHLTCICSRELRDTGICTLWSAPGLKENLCCVCGAGLYETRGVSPTGNRACSGGCTY